MTDVRRFSVAKPTIKTPFHIDYAWWAENERDWRIHLLSYLSEEHQKAFSEGSMSDQFDIIDPETAVVRQVDGLQHLLVSHYAKQDSFLRESTSVVETIFRVFLANGNQPLSPEQLAGQLQRPADTILRVLTGGRIYRGLRPAQ